MRRIDLEQNSEVWFDFRKYKLGGSKYKSLKPLSRGKYKGLAEGSAGFWKMISERLSLGKDGETESERDRGHRLEEASRLATNKQFGLSLVKGTVWQDDDNDRLYISPDDEDPSDVIWYAQETKAFDPDKHLRIIWEDVQAQKIEGYRPFDSIPDENKDQAVHYFTINKDLKTLYWSLHSDLVAYEELEHYTLVIPRESIQKEIAEHKVIQKQILTRTDQIVRELVDKFVKGL